VNRASRSSRSPGARWRAVVTDVDGTLTDVDRRLDPRAVAAVRTLERQGIPVVLATGNVLPIALALHRSLGLSGPIVAENGGVTYRTIAGSPVVDRLADRALALRAWRRVRAAGLPVRRLFTDRWRESEVALEPTVSVARLRAAVGRLPVRVESTGFAVHLIARDAGKLPALRRVLEPIGLTVGECVVLGDGDNDVEMLRRAGFGVSFPSGSRRARAAARYVTHGEYGAGFVEGLKASGILGGPGPDRGGP